MKKIFLMFIMSLLLVSIVSAVETVFVDDNVDSFIIVEYSASQDFLDLFDLGAIVPPFVQAGQTITYREELNLKPTASFSEQTCPTDLFVEIKNENGVRVNSFSVPVPLSVCSNLDNFRSVLFEAQMVVPTQTGRYSYDSYPRLNGIRHIMFEQLATRFFRVEGEVFEACIPDVKNVQVDTENGIIKKVCTIPCIDSQLSPSNEKCTENVVCDDGFNEENGNCVKIVDPEPKPEEDEDVGCGIGEVCCRYKVYMSSNIADFEHKRSCAISTECNGFSLKFPSGTIVDNELCVSKDGGDKVTSKVKGILEEELEDKTETELEDSACKRTSECEEGATCVPFNKLSLDVRQTLSKGLFNVAEEGLCVFEKDTPDEPPTTTPDLCSWTESWAPEFLGTQCATGWFLAIIGLLSVIVIINISSKK